ncbi:MAG TPA: NADH-quinone oxidoreductase subunit C [Candidatus Thermoplasmatota archaeon]
MADESPQKKPEDDAEAKKAGNMTPGEQPRATPQAAATEQPTPASTAPTASPAKPVAPSAPPAAAIAKPPAAPRPKTMTPEIQSLLAGLGAKAQHLDDTDPNIPTILIDKTALIETMRRLRFEYRFDHLACLTATDMKTEFEVVYNLWSYAQNRPLEVKVRLAKTDATVPSLCGIWKGANWLEREEWDLVGIKFDGHPDHRRILLPEGWQGHPLRKDYDLKKEQFVGLADNGEDVVFQEPREGAW